MYIKLLLIVVVIMYYCSPIIEGLFIEDWYHIIVDPIMGKNSDHKQLVQEHYEELMNNFMSIFPDRNRNAGGPQFYEYVYSHKDTLTKDKFMLYHTFYCGVSGSPIDPSRGKTFDYITIDHIDGSTYIGKYYRCCWPCLCDIYKYAKVEHHTVTLQDGFHEHMVITIDDPCSNEDKIPDSVSSFNCSNGITENGIRTESGRLIIAVLHEHELYEPTKHKNLIDPVLKQCENRLNTDPDDLRGGMGDIFVKLSIIKDS
tara:strand:+ start:427 stop:1197 length:771 start_codon:yes stop_codon:yes gene_type:complete